MDSLKAELKSFEKSFKEEFGREPDRNDIKVRPEIGQCFTLYFL